MPIRPSQNIRKSLVVHRAAVVIACFCASGVAQASLEYRSLYLQRDFMLFLAALLTLVLFYILRGNHPAVRMRPIGRRITDLTTLARASGNVYVRWDSMTSSSWEARAIAAFPVRIPSDSQCWHITLFRAERLELQGHFAGTTNGFFLLAPSTKLAEEILGPMERKVYHRFRKCFASAKIIRGKPTDESVPCFTWYSSLEPLQELVLQFLTMCVAISEDVQIEGAMTFHRGSSFWVEVNWPEIPELESLEVQLEEQETMQVIRAGERVGIRLHLSVPEHVLRAKVPAPVQKSA